MSRIPKVKDFIHTRLANTYGGWIYCDNCGENIGYLCYVTYDNFRLEYQCKCGNHGKLNIEFHEERDTSYAKEKLIQVKNRQCCPKDHSPLITILSKKLDFYKYEIRCIQCDTKYKEEMKND